MTPIAPLITAFLRVGLAIERGTSQHTCDTYAYAFKLLFEFTGTKLNLSPSKLCLEHISAPLVLSFLENIERSRNNSSVTRNSRLAAIKSFMRFVEYRVPSALEQIQSVLAIPTKKTDTRLVAYLSKEEIQALLDAPDTTTRFGIRDRAMLYLCFGKRPLNPIFFLTFVYVMMHHPKNIKEGAHDKKMQKEQSIPWSTTLAGACNSTTKEWSELCRVLQATSAFVPCSDLLAEKTFQAY